MGNGMSLVIEDGTGVTGADTFISLAECDVIAVALFGASFFGGVAALNEAALRRAFYYMKSLSWATGYWPLFGGAIPDDVKRAQAVFARAESAAIGALSPSVTLTGQKALVGVDSIKWQVLGGDATVANSRPIVTAGFDFLKPWLDYNPSGSGGGTTGIMLA
jgi:hypothetical protein